MDGDEVSRRETDDKETSKGRYRISSMSIEQACSIANDYFRVLRFGYDAVMAVRVFALASHGDQNTGNKKSSSPRTSPGKLNGRGCCFRYRF